MSGIIAQNTLDNSGLIKSPAGGGAWNFISKQTASASADISFTSGIDSTYKEYLFTFNNIHPEVADKNFMVNFSADTGSNYNVTKTTTYFHATQYENDAAASIAYRTGTDLAQSTAGQQLMNGIKADSDSSGAGYLHLFNPSSTTFVKHFIAVTNIMQDNTLTQNAYIAGYCNTTSAVDAIQFSMSSDNIDAGDICLYGIN